MKIKAAVSYELVGRTQGTLMKMDTFHKGYGVYTIERYHA